MTATIAVFAIIGILFTCYLLSYAVEFVITPVVDWVWDSLTHIFLRAEATYREGLER